MYSSYCSSLSVSVLTTRYILVFIYPTFLIGISGIIRCTLRVYFYNDETGFGVYKNSNVFKLLIIVLNGQIILVDSSNGTCGTK